MVPERESWEGIRDTTLRVFIQHTVIDDVDGRINPATNEFLLDSARNRAEVLLMSFVRLHVSGPERIAACQQQIQTVISKGIIRRRYCSDDHCAVYVDFDIADFLKAAE